MESNQNLIRANKQPAYHATKTDGTESLRAKAPSLPDSEHLGNANFRTPSPTQAEILQDATQESDRVTLTVYTLESPEGFQNSHAWAASTQHPQVLLNTVLRPPVQAATTHAFPAGITPVHSRA